MVNSLAWEKPKIPCREAKSVAHLFDAQLHLGKFLLFEIPSERGRAREGRLSPLGPPEDPGRLHVSQQIDTVLDGAEAM